jgi:undecaprenyl-phosphate 4-deoxy-4-formamido-L-arabinose transferase
MKGCSVVIPVYNSAEGIPRLITELAEWLPRLDVPYEVILVNDGSRDNSWEAIDAQTRQQPWVCGINLMRNYGQHNALLCGIRAASQDTIVTLDDDLQNPPSEIAKLIAKLHEGYDVVYGTPRHEQHGLLRDAASRVTKLALQSAMGAQTARNVSAFRAFRTHLRDGFANYQSPYLSIDVLLTWATTRFAAVQVQHHPRQFGVSNYSLAKLINHAFNMMTGFSTLPLRLASLLGFVLTLFGAGVLIWVFGRLVLLGYSVPGFPFLASIIAVFSGAQMFAIGIFGEYLGRMHFRLMERPTYVVREVTNASDL